MKVLDGTVEDISNYFSEFEESLNDVDYVVTVYSRIFEYKDDEKVFNLKNLKNIFPQEESINGDIKNISWKSSHKEINKYLSYGTYLHGITEDPTSDFRIISDDELEKRKNVFWGIVKKYIEFPAEIVFKHIPIRPSYFGDFVLWGMCYIFLSKGKGIVIYLEACDSFLVFITLPLRSQPFYRYTQKRHGYFCKQGRQNVQR